MRSVSRAITRQAWVDRLERFSQVDQTVAEFCAAEGVSVASFYQWRRKLHAETPATTPLARFVPVSLPPSEPAAPTTVMSVELPGGVHVRFEVTGSP